MLPRRRTFDPTRDQAAGLDPFPFEREEVPQASFPAMPEWLPPIAARSPATPTPTASAHTQPPKAEQDAASFNAPKAGVKEAVPAEAPAPLLVPRDALAAQQWHLDAIDVKTAWDSYSGKGIRVGIIDDGFDYRHTDVDARFSQSLDYDVRNRDSDAAATTASDNHGTAVLGVVAAELNGAGSVGIAHGSTVLGVRMGFGADGSLGQIRDALTRMLSVDVANSSWGFEAPFADDFGSTAFSGIATAIQDGATRGRSGLGTNFVFAAGNGAQAGDDANAHDLSNSPYVIAVGATDQEGLPTWFSTPGSCVLVSAPGEGIVTTDRRGAAGYVAGDYVAVDGTSFAAPIVSGVIALMLEANKSLGYRDVQEILAYSAQQPPAVTDWTTNGALDWNGGGLMFNDSMGFGLVDANAAVRLAETWTARSVFSNRALATASSDPTRAPMEIPDLGSLTDTLTLSASGIEVDRVELTVKLSHNWVGDLVISLTSPTGTTSQFLGNLSGGAYSGTSLSFTMDSVQFWGEQAIGAWTLTIEDNQPNDAGVLNAWSLQVIGDRTLGDDTYVYTDAFATLAQNGGRALLQDASGVDAVNFAAVSGNTVFDLTLGGTVAGQALVVGTGTVLENAFSGDGNDALTGNEVANWLRGGRGADTLSGGEGNDRLWGEQGRDVLTGGSGRDSFVFRTVADLGDVITDYQDNWDRIEVGQLLRSVGYTGTSPFTSGHLVQRIDAVSGNLQLVLDTDGSRFARAQQQVIATFEGITTPSLELNWDVFLV